MSIRGFTVIGASKCASIECCERIYISDFGNNNATTESIVRVSLDLLITSVYVRKNVLLTNNRFRVTTT